MRGVPAAGKSTAAKKLAGRNGLICETDSYFGPPGKKYDFKSVKRNAARTANMNKFSKALKYGISPIIIDRGNGKGRRTLWYVEKAFSFGYRVEFREPLTLWWGVIKKLIKERFWNEVQLKVWADLLADKQRHTHGVSAKQIYRSMLRYDPTLTVEGIIRGKKAKTKQG